MGFEPGGPACEHVSVTDLPPEETKPRQSLVPFWIIVSTVTLVLFVAFVLPAMWQGRCGAQQAVESTTLRKTCSILSQRQAAGQEMPRSLAELFYDGSINLDRLDHCTQTNYSKIKIGAYSIREIARRAMTPEELDAELRRVYPKPPSWETVGPLTMCLDGEAYATADAARVVGWMSGGHGDRRWMNIATSDQKVSIGYWLGKEWLVDAVDRSLAYFEARGIPMPAEAALELRRSVSVPPPAP